MEDKPAVLSQSQQAMPVADTVAQPEAPVAAPIQDDEIMDQEQQDDD